MNIETDLSPKDPQWVGAWWIGFVILYVVMLFWTFPVMMFPERLPGSGASSQARADLKAMAKGEQNINERKSISLIY